MSQINSNFGPAGTTPLAMRQQPAEGARHLRHVQMLRSNAASAPAEEDDTEPTVRNPDELEASHDGQQKPDSRRSKAKHPSKDEKEDKDEKSEHIDLTA